MNWKLTPTEFLRELGWDYKRKGNWLTMPLCPFCQGGDNHDRLTFIVHIVDGNYSCSRAKCGERGTFWALMLAVGREPREYLGERICFTPKPRKKGYIYGR